MNVQAFEALDRLKELKRAYFSSSPDVTYEMLEAQALVVLKFRQETEKRLTGKAKAVNKAAIAHLLRNC